MKHAIIAVGMAIALASSSANAGVMVHMFGWKYNDIANECENVLGPKGYDGVEISSPAEHVTGDGWWIAYQPVNYKNFTAIGGNESELKSLITRCHKAGIKVYADAVFNQLSDSTGTGSGGSSFGRGAFPAFSAKEVHTAGTLEDATARLHPAQAEAAIGAARALEIPVVGLDLLVPAADQPDYVLIEANERVGLANHEPQPTAERFIDLLFPLSRVHP